MAERGQRRPKFTDLCEGIVPAHTHTNTHTVAGSPWRCTLVGNVLQIGAVCRDDGPANRWTGVCSLGYWPSAYHTALPDPTALIHLPRLCRSRDPFRPVSLNLFSPPRPLSHLFNYSYLLSNLLLLIVLWRGLVDCQTGA